MVRTTRQRRAGWAAGAIFGLAALSELLRLVTDDPWQRLHPNHSHASGIALTLLWGGAAFACITGRRKLALLPIFGAFALLPHFVITRTAGSPLGIAYLVALPIVVLLVWVAFGRHLRLGEPKTEETMPEPPREPGKVIL